MAMSTLRLIILALTINIIMLVITGNTLNFATIGEEEPSIQNIHDTIMSNKLTDLDTDSQNGLNSDETAPQPGEFTQITLGNIFKIGKIIFNLFFPLNSIDNIKTSLANNERLELITLLTMETFRILLNIILLVDLIMFLFSKKVS